MEKKSGLTSISSINALTDDISQLNLSFKIPFGQLKLDKQLGEGGFGVVYQATYLHADVAFKQLKSKKLGEQAQEEWVKETQVMAQLRSPFIVQLYGITTEPGHYGMVMEYLPKGSLFDLLQSKASLDWTVRYQIGLDVGKGVTFLHAHKIIHRDLKSLNVLLDTNYRAKLCDFGLAKVKTLSSSTDTSISVGTLAWMAPELFKRKAVYSFASDIYSYGMVLWEIGSRRIPFEDSHGNQALIMQWVSNGEREEIPEETPKLMKEAIQACWQADPEKRPTASQVVKQLQVGIETSQLQSKPSYLDNLSSQMNKLPSQLVNPSLSSGPQPLDNLSSANSAVSLKQIVTSGPRYLDNFTSQAKASSIISGPQYLPNNGIIVTTNLKPSLPNLQAMPSTSIVLPKTASSEPMFLNSSVPIKTPLPVLNLKDTPENLVQAAQSLIRGHNWTPVQKTYFQTLIETLLLPPMQTLMGHEDHITSLLLLPSGEIVSGSCDTTLKVWDMKTGTCVKTLTGHSDRVTSLLLLPSGEVVSGSGDKMLKVWNMKTGTCVKTLTGHKSDVTSLLLLSSGEVVSGSGGTLKVWNMKTGTCVKTLTGHSNWVTSLLLLPSGEVVSGSDDKMLKVWDMKTGQCVKTLTGHSQNVTSLLLLPSGEIVSGSWDKTLKVWNVKTGECVKTLVGHIDFIDMLRLVSNTCFVSSAHGEIKYWNLSNYTCEHTYARRGDIEDLLPLSATECLIASGRTLERITWQPYVLLSQALTRSTLPLTASTYAFFKESIKRQGKRLPRTLMGHKDPVSILLVLPSGEVVSGSVDNTLKVWNMKTGQCVKTLVGHSGLVDCLLLLPSGEVISGSWDKTLKVWDMKTGNCIKTLTGHSNWVTSLLLLSNRELVSGSADNTLKVWDIKTGQYVKTLMGHEHSVTGLLLLPSGEVVSGSKDKTLKMWNIKTGQCVKTLTGHEQPVTSLLLLPSGEVVSGSDDNTIKIWDMKTGQCMKTLAGHSDPVWNLLLLPSGEVVSGSVDNTLKIWDMKTGQCMNTLTGHEAPIISLLLLPNGEVVSGSRDGTLKVWNMKTGQCVKTLPGYRSGVNSLLLLSSGEVVSSSAATLKVWDIYLEKTIEELETQAPECRQM